MEYIQKEHKYQKVRNTWNSFYWNIRFGHRVGEHTNTGAVTGAKGGCRKYGLLLTVLL